MTKEGIGVKMKTMRNIILASRSPRRKAILEMAGINCTVMPSHAEENIRVDTPQELVSALSGLKAGEVAARLDGDYVVIGADTIVCYEGQILGKPKDGTDAFNTLHALSGNTHTVYTGVTVLETNSSKECTFCEETDVTMLKVPDAALRKYVETGDPMDKAGSYGIQGKGAFLVEKINGDFYNVVGLPIARLMKVLAEQFKLVF